MKVYLGFLSDEGPIIYGVFSSEELANEVQAEYVKEYSTGKNRINYTEIVEEELDKIPDWIRKKLKM